MWEGFQQDLSYAARSLRKSPGLVVTVVLVMGLGIGANTAIFSFVNAVLLHQSISYKSPESAVRLSLTRPQRDMPEWFSYPDYVDFRDRGDVFAATAIASDGFPLSVLGEQGAEFEIAEAYSAGIFSILDAPPALGRSFLPEEDLPGCEPVVMISHAVWQSKYGGDPGILGRTLYLAGRPVTVVGVGAEGFRGTLVLFTTDYWLSLGTAATLLPSYVNLEIRTAHDFSAMANLKPGISVAQAQARLAALAGNLAQEYPESNAGRRVLVTPATQVRTDPLMDKVLAVLSGFMMVVVGLVLVVACSNLAGLLLVRAAARQREAAIRLALGASRRRLVRQFLMESTLLALLGGAVGLLFTEWAAAVMASFKPPLPVMVTFNYRMDGTVLAFTLLLSLLTGVLFGLAPALRLSRHNVMDIIRGGLPQTGLWGKRTTSHGRLVVLQIALSLVLLVAAGAFLRGLTHTYQADTGFRTEHLAAATVDLSLGNYAGEDAGRAFFQQYADRIRAIPGVQRVALASRLPLGLWGKSSASVRLPGAPLDSPRDLPQVDTVSVTPEYFDALGVPILRGRNFTADDARGATTAVIVSEAMGQRFWGNGDPLGQTLLVGKPGKEQTAVVVGVARDTKVRNLREEPRPYLYFAHAQRFDRLAVVIAHTTGDPSSLPPIFRRELQQMDPNLPLLEAQTMPQHLGLHLYLPQMGSAFVSAFGLLALALASIGLHGMVAFSVAVRTREIAIRTALGATQNAVTRMVLRQGFRLAAVGAAIGLPVAALVTLPITRWLTGAASIDLMALAGVVLLLAAVSILACYPPARRAARVEPMAALRHE